MEVTVISGRLCSFQTQPLGLNEKCEAAGGATTENLGGVVVAGLRDERDGIPLFDPAPGALVLSSERHAKAVKAINREFRRIKRRLYLEYAKLRFLKLFFQTKASVLEAIGNMNRFLP